jgi:hypothetical protein
VAVGVAQSPGRHTSRRKSRRGAREQESFEPPGRRLVESLHKQSALAHELLDAAMRDLGTFTDLDAVNGLAAGQAALRELGAAFHVLTDVRNTLGSRLGATQAGQGVPQWAAGNSALGRRPTLRAHTLTARVVGLTTRRRSDR